MKDSLYSVDQEFYINGSQLSGVSSVNGNYSIPTKANNFLGYVGPVEVCQNGPGRADFSFSRSMVTSDKAITRLIDDTGFNGGLIYNGKYLGFNSGYLTSYSASFSVDSIPNTQASISVYGEMGPSVSPETEPDESDLEYPFIPMSSGITINCDGRESNRVTNFSFSIKVKRQPMLKVGSIFPCQVISSTPIESNFEVDLEVDDYETKNVYDYIKTGVHRKNIKIELIDKCDNSKKITYNLDGSRLVSEKFSVDSNNNTSVALSYVLYGHNPPTISYT